MEVFLPECPVMRPSSFAAFFTSTIILPMVPWLMSLCLYGNLLSHVAWKFGVWKNLQPASSCASVLLDLNTFQRRTGQRSMSSIAHSFVT